ncbi:hypothetical protein JZ751_019396 [Albula glossodonta]|uniref:Protein kinase domain-containing protein n=1 Tax=Albula glossodonta TaxID=121402 RepID=A0A8T2NMP0_9TELE|nr:hypothetical protein JZ751_019396 [Albula glossodonta]
MSKRVTLATCIAKMYEGGRLDNGGVQGAGTSVKKPTNTLLNNSSSVEVKLNLLEARVEQIAGGQAEVLKKVDAVLQGVECLEKDVAAMKRARGTLDTPQAGDPASLSEIRALCGETVALLQSLRQEGERQWTKMVGIESSISAIDKVLGYVKDTFRSSKVVEYILRGVVPWRRGSLLESEDNEKRDEKTVKPKVKSCSQGTQVQQGPINAAEGFQGDATSTHFCPDETQIAAGPGKAVQNEAHVTVTATPSSPDFSPSPLPTLDVLEVQTTVPRPAGCDSAGKGPRRPKEVTLWSREPTRTQTFTKETQDIGVGTGDLDGMELEQNHGQAQEASTNGGKVAEGVDALVEITGVMHQGTVAEEHQEMVAADPQRINTEWAPVFGLHVQESVEKELQAPVTDGTQTSPSALSEERREEKTDKYETSPESSTFLPANMGLQAKEDILPTVSPHDFVVNVVEQTKDSTEQTSMLKSESKHQAEPDQSQSQREPVPSLSQNKQHLPGPCDITQLIPSASEEKVKSLEDGEKQTNLEVTSSEIQKNSSSNTPDEYPRVIDDCPPLPAPFEHRIVSAKQVPMGSYYAVKQNEILGGGRFGQVHKCAELSSGLTLAAKIIKVKGMKERDEVKNEIGVMNQLNHVNLIQLYDAFESRTNLTLIMEYVEGGELFDRIIDENYQLTELDAIVFMRQICEGVQYLHQQYILHLDLKVYRPREKLKVNFGTPEFLAPEVVNYDFVSFPTDMWSVGVITYMLLSGLSPFLGDTDAETMNNILHANWDFDAEAFESVSEEAKDFISRLLVPEKCGRLSATGCMKHSWLNNLEEKAKIRRVRLKSQLRLQRYLAAHRQWKKHFLAVAAANRLKRFRQNHSVKPA